MRAIIEAIDVEIANHHAAIGKLEQARDLLADEVVPEPEPEPEAKPVVDKKPAARGRKQYGSSAEIDTAILNELTRAEQGTRDLVDRIGKPYNTVAYRVKCLVEWGKIESAGKRGRTPLWRKVESKQVSAQNGNGAKPKSKPAPTTNGTQQPSLEGRVYGLICHRKLSPPEICRELDADLQSVEAVARKLVHDGDAEWMSNGQLLGRP